jgi:hypothetical protein
VGTETSAGAKPNDAIAGAKPAGASAKPAETTYASEDRVTAGADHGVDGSAGTDSGDHTSDLAGRSSPTDQSLLQVSLEALDNSLLQVVNSGWRGLDLRSIVSHRYGDDLFFKNILESPKSFRNFEVEDSVVYLKQEDVHLLCIPALVHQGRNLREIIISEAHSILAHLGVRKTLDYLWDHVWWKDIVEDTRSFCETCTTCKRSKSSTQKPYGLLYSLNPPSQPWEVIGIDFVGPLPESKNRDGVFNSITVVINLLTGMVHLIASCINYTARQIAELMFESIYKLHGLPKSIVSDRDVLFTSTFWK